jgi:cell division protease FtsH
MIAKDTPPKNNSTRWIGWWLIFVALLIWNIWVIWPKQQVAVDLPYSTFLDQVKTGNVAEVKITGSDIQGSFVKPFSSTSLDLATPSGTTNSSSSKPINYQEFRTLYPDSVGDPDLMPLLTQHSVKINVAEVPTPWFTLLLTDGLPFILLLVLVVWMSRQATRSQEGIFSFGRSKARKSVADHPHVTFADVAGEDEAKEELREVVDFLREPAKYRQIGARIPQGVLLVGPPGTGKTLLARAVAGEAGVPFFIISASEFVEMFVGVGASRVRDLFSQAKAIAPAIVFIDELDAVGRRRGAGLGSVNDEREQTLNQLLVEMDGFAKERSDINRPEIIVIAATNRPDVLDPALLRPGRFDRQVVVGLPDRQGREGILKIHTRSINLASDVNLGLLARTTTGFSGADLENLCNEGALTAARKNHTKVTMEDFEEALDRVLLGASRALLLDEHERQVVAYHEAGHALIAWFTPGADSVHKVTIIPRGRALGITEQLPEDDRYNYSQGYLLSRLKVMLGGRASEEVSIHEVTTGAENDLVEATRLARRMVTRWGMGSLGLMALSADEEHPFLGYELSQQRDYSEQTASQIDSDVTGLLDHCYEEDKKLLTDLQPKLDELVTALLHEETIDQDGLTKILGPRGQEPVSAMPPVENVPLER